MKKIFFTFIALLLATCSVLAHPSNAQTHKQYVPSETPVGTYHWLLDPEFDFTTNQVTWLDMLRGDIWMCNLDPNTGEYIPADCKGTLIEAGAMPWSDFFVTVNGPEWAKGVDSQGKPIDMIVYTRFPQGAMASTADAEFAVATTNPTTGTWSAHSTNPLQRNAPFGSRSENYSPKVTYNDAYGNHYWRDLVSGYEEALPMLVGTGLTPAVRFSDQLNAVVYPAIDPFTGVAQVFSYNLSNHTLTQLTTDAGNKSQPWTWVAPDYGNKSAMLTVIGGNMVTIYTQQYGAWVQTQTAVAPNGGSWFSTEPFVYQSKSYVLAQYTRAGQNWPSSIWLISFDPSNPFMRQLTPNQPDVTRADPEIVFTNNGPIVEYSRFDQTKGSYWLCLACLQGEYKTGLILP